MQRLAAAILIGMVATGCSGGSDDPPGGATGDAGGTTTAPVQPRTARVGEKVDLANGDSVRVHGYDGNATPSNEFSRARPGMTFRAVDVEACAGPQRSQDGVVNPFDFVLLLPDGGRAQSSIPVKEPGLGVAPLDPGRCTRGFVTYEVIAGVTPTAVVFERPGLNVRWTVA